MNPAPQIEGCLPKGFNEHSLLTVPQFATWRQISEATARKQIAAGLVPVIESSREDLRVHVASYLAKK